MTKYYPDKQNKRNKYCYLNSNKIHGFQITPKNNIKYEGIEVSKLILLKPTLIEKVLKRKTKIKLNNYLDFIINLTEEDDTDPDNLVLIIDDIKKYRNLIINKYSKFLDQNYIKKLLLKSKFVEEELKSRLTLYEITNKNFKSRGR